MANIQQILKLVTQADASGMNAISGGFDSLGSKGSGVMGMLGSGLKDLAIAGAAAGVAAGAFFTASINAAADFQSAMAKTQGLAGATADQMKIYNQGILDLTTKIPVSAKDAADGLFFVVSAGYKGADAMQVLTVAAKAAASGLGNTKDIAGLVTSALTDYKLTAADASTITDKLTAAVTDGKASADEFAPALAKVLPIAASMGISFDQVTASVATMTRAGMTASEAGTALRGTLSALDKPGKQAQDALASIGLSADQLKDKIANEGLMQTLDDLMKLTGGDVETLGMIIPNIRALTGVLASAGQQQDSYAQTLTDIQNSAGKTDKAFAVAKDTFNFQLGLLKNDLNKILIEVGSALLPLVTPILQALGGALSDFGALVSKFLDTHKKDFTDFATAVMGAFQNVVQLIEARVLPVIQTFFGWIRDQALPIARELINYILTVAIPAFENLINTQIVPRAQALWAILQQVGDWFKTVAFPAALSAFQTAMAWIGDHRETVVGALAALAAAYVVLTAVQVAASIAAVAANLPLIALIATIALVGGAIALLITHWDDITKKIPALGIVVNDLKEDLDKFWSWLNTTFVPKVTAAFDAVVTWLRANWGEITRELTGPFEIAYNSIKGVFDLIRDVVQLQLKVVGDIISIALDLISGNWKGAWNDIKQLFSDVWNGIKTIVGDQISDVEGVLGGAWTTISNALMGPFEWFRDNIGQVISAAVNFIVSPLNGIISAFNDMGSGIAKAVNWVTSKLGLGNVLDWQNIDQIHVNLNFAGAAKSVGNVSGFGLAGIGSAFSAVNAKGGGVSSPYAYLPTAGSGNFAAGGSMPDGFAWVGEEGPELAHKAGSSLTIIPSGPSAALAASMGMSIPGYFLGTPNWGDALGDVAGAIKGAGSAAISFAKEWAGKGIDKLVNAAFDQFGVKAPVLPGSLSGIGGAVFGQLKDKIVEAIKQVFDKGKSALGSSQPGTPQQVIDWIQAAIAATGADPGWEQGLDIIADYESGGDPNAYNPVDVGNGEHAQGLMQTIPSTFAAYAMAGHGDINNPIDNAIASIRYIQARYGDINNVPGVASVLSGGAYLPYARGGWIQEPVVGIGTQSGATYSIAENNPEYVSNGPPAIPLPGQAPVAPTASSGDNNLLSDIDTNTADTARGLEPGSPFINGVTNVGESITTTVTNVVGLASRSNDANQIAQLQAELELKGHAATIAGHSEDAVTYYKDATVASDHILDIMGVGVQNLSDIKTLNDTTRGDIIEGNGLVSSDINNLFDLSQGAFAKGDVAQGNLIGEALKQSLNLAQITGNTGAINQITPMLAQVAQWSQQTTAYMREVNDEVGTSARTSSANQATQIALALDTKQANAQTAGNTQLAAQLAQDSNTATDHMLDLVGKGVGNLSDVKTNLDTLRVDMQAGDKGTQFLQQDTANLIGVGNQALNNLDGKGAQLVATALENASQLAAIQGNTSLANTLHTASVTLGQQANTVLAENTAIQQNLDVSLRSMNANDQAIVAQNIAQVAVQQHIAGNTDAANKYLDESNTAANRALGLAGDQYKQLGYMTDKLSDIQNINTLMRQDIVNGNSLSSLDVNNLIGIANIALTHGDAGNAMLVGNALYQAQQLAIIAGNTSLAGTLGQLASSIFKLAGDTAAASAQNAAYDAYMHATGSYPGDRPGIVNTGPAKYTAGGLYNGFGGNSGVPLPADPYNGGAGAARFASGGVLTEPVSGIGLWSGKLYTFAEKQPERVSPTNVGNYNAGGQGQQIVTVQPGAVIIPAADLEEMRTVTDFFDRIIPEQRARGV